MSIQFAPDDSKNARTCATVAEPALVDDNGDPVSNITPTIEHAERPYDSTVPCGSVSADSIEHSAHPSAVYGKAITNDFATQGQIYLAWLQTLESSMTDDLLSVMSAADLAQLRELRNSTDIGEFITSDDIASYRSPETSKPLSGLISIPEYDGSSRWHVIDASDSRTTPDAQKAYIQHHLIPRLCGNLVQIYRCTPDSFVGMTPSALHQLTSLVAEIEAAGK